MGGGSSTTTKNEYDPEATKLQREIANWQMGMAEEQYQMYKDYFMESEIATAKANQEMQPYVSQAAIATLKEQARDIELNQPLKDAQREQQMKDIAAGGKVSDEFYKQALEGVNVKEKMDQAQNDVAMGFKQSETAARRNLGRMGINSPRAMAMMGATALDKAKAIGSARTGARTSAEDTNFARLQAGMGIYSGSGNGSLAGIQTTQGNSTQGFDQANPLAAAMSASGQSSSSNSVLANRVMSSTSTTQESLGLGDIAGAVGGFAMMSSIEYKENVKPFSFDSEKLYELLPVLFNYKWEDIQQVGLIAEEVEKTAPEMVLHNDGVTRVDYGYVIFGLLNEMKKLREQVKDLTGGN